MRTRIVPLDGSGQSWDPAPTTARLVYRATNGAEVWAYVWDDLEESHPNACPEWPPPPVEARP